MTISFVILHYMSYEDTVECIDSILMNIEYVNYNIIIIDNNSTNDSIYKIIDKYKSNIKIDVIINNENLGFANGNNIGYRIAKEKYNSDFIIMLNNDTIINQKNFLDLILDRYEENKYYLLGPDIITITGIHQNPQRLEGMSIDELKTTIKYLKKEYFMKKIISTFKLHTLKRIIKRKIKSKNMSYENRCFNNMLMQNVQLHGACIIFSPLYISKQEFAFYPDTYMYGEEDILFYICKINNYKIIFDPNIKIIHKEDCSTDMVLKNNFEKRYFIVRNLYKSLKILHNMMLNNDTI